MGKDPLLQETLILTMSCYSLYFLLMICQKNLDDDCKTIMYAYDTILIVKLRIAEELHVYTF